MQNTFLIYILTDKVTSLPQNLYINSDSPIFRIYTATYLPRSDIHPASVCAPSAGEDYGPTPKSPDRPGTNARISGDEVHRHNIQTSNQRLSRRCRSTGSHCRRKMDCGNHTLRDQPRGDASQLQGNKDSSSWMQQKSCNETNICNLFIIL